MNNGLGFSLYATHEYVEEQVVKPKSQMYLQDETDGSIYAVRIENENFVSEKVCSYIAYAGGNQTLTIGSAVNYSDFPVYKGYNDGTVSPLDPSEMTIEPEIIKEDTKNLVIKYHNNGIECSTTINISTVPFDPEAELIDFDYTDNGNGTYTITGWKQTLNGVESTKMVIPFNESIIL